MINIKHMAGRGAVKLALGCVIGSIALGVAPNAAAFDQRADGVYQDRIDWGLMMDMSGTASASQIPWVNGVQAYLRQVNDAGGIHGRKVNLLVEDDRSDASLTRVNYERLVNQTPVLGISGLGNSSAQAAMMPLIRRGKVPIVGSYAITKAGFDPATPMYSGGFCGTREMAQVGVGFFADKLKLKAPKVAVLHMDVAGGKEYAQFIDAEALKRGGSSTALPIKVGAADVTAQVLEVRCLISARSAPKAFDLRCEVREKMMAFLRDEVPEALARQRLGLA